MTEPGFDDLAALWNEPDGTEQEDSVALARKARRQGQLLAYVDFVFAMLLLGGIALIVFMTPNRTTIVAAVVLLVATAWITWKRRAMRQMSSALKTETRIAFLESSVTNAAGNLRRVTLSLVAFPIMLMIAVALKVSIRNGGHIEHPLIAISQWAVSTRGIVSMSLMALFFAAILRSRLKIKRELGRLKDVQEEYAAEAIRESVHS